MSGKKYQLFLKSVTEKVFQSVGINHNCGVNAINRNDDNNGRKISFRVLY
jgi:hypothetical protein